MTDEQFLEFTEIMVKVMMLIEDDQLRDAFGNAFSLVAETYVINAENRYYADLYRHSHQLDLFRD